MAGWSTGSSTCCAFESSQRRGRLIMGGGAFAEWQPRYAEVGIATFPVDGKAPSVTRLPRSQAGRQPEARRPVPRCEAFGLALKPSSITVVDVDTPDERVLADALARHGETPFIVRSGSGHFQAWYRRQNEGRRVRPDRAAPIDILGDGFVVAPPSVGEKGPYRDHPGLPCRPPYAAAAAEPAPAARAGGMRSRGPRNDTLWRHCMQQAHHCDDFEALLDVARTANESYLPPLTEAEVVKTARSAWGYTSAGENRFGRGRIVLGTHDEVDDLLDRNPDAFILLTILRRHHWGRDFVVANAMAEQHAGRWLVAEAVRSARATALLELGRIVGVRKASSLYGRPSTAGVCR